MTARISKNKRTHGPASRKPGGNRQRHPDGRDTDLWIWGVHPVLDLLKHSPKKLLKLNVLANKSNEKIDRIEELAVQHGITIQRRNSLVSGEKGNHQGVEALIKPIAFLSLNELLLKSAEVPQPLFLALDSIQDPHNLGAIIRSASAAGVQGIIMPKDRSAPISGTVAKTAAGSLAKMNLCQVTNLAEALKKLKDQGVWVFGAAGDADQGIYESDLKGSACLVIGSEGKGIRPLVRKQCDLLISVPMHSSLDSLNASVATAVILFEIVRQRS